MWFDGIQILFAAQQGVPSTSGTERRDSVSAQNVGSPVYSDRLCSRVTS